MMLKSHLRNLIELPLNKFIMGKEIYKYLIPNNNDDGDDKILLTNSYIKEISNVKAFFQLFNPIKKQDL